MNNSRAKQLRRIAKEMPGPWCEYKEQESHFVNLGTRKDPKFEEVTDPIALTDTCGRQTYKLMKRVF